MAADDDDAASAGVTTSFAMVDDGCSITSTIDFASESFFRCLIFSFPTLIASFIVSVILPFSNDIGITIMVSLVLYRVSLSIFYTKKYEILMRKNKLLSCFFWFFGVFWVFGFLGFWVFDFYIDLPTYS
jgi:hypothetical protein